MTTSTPLTTQIAELIGSTLLIEVPGPDVDLIETGLIDSLALVTLITEIEAEFEIELPLDEFDIERFRSAEQIAAYVANHLPSAGGG
jgi:D-alanine--poly(phosphoribitol) ligase subunit 2